MTVSNGTSSTCRANLPRNSPDPGIPIEFTVRSPRENYSWRVRQESGLMTGEPIAGIVATTGPFQARVMFDGRSLNLSSGLSFSQNMRLEIVDTPNAFGPGGALTGNVVAACGVTLFGFVPSGQ